MRGTGQPPPLVDRGGHHSPWWLPWASRGGAFSLGCWVLFVAFCILGVWTVTQCDFNDKRIFRSHRVYDPILSSTHHFRLDESLLGGERSDLKVKIARILSRVCIHQFKRALDERFFLLSSLIFAL